MQMHFLKGDRVHAARRRKGRNSTASVLKRDYAFLVVCGIPEVKQAWQNMHRCVHGDRYVLAGNKILSPFARTTAFKRFKEMVPATRFELVTP